MTTNARKSTPDFSTPLILQGKKVVIYARVSTVDQTCQNQITQLKSYACAQGWVVIDVVTDVCSGSKRAGERRGLEKVFAQAHRREFDLLLFWALDRLSREGSRQTISYLMQLEQFGVAWHSFTEPYLSTLGIFGDAVIALLGALGKQEGTLIPVCILPKRQVSPSPYEDFPARMTVLS